MDNYDFSGWATRPNRKCSDGRTILTDAFKGCDGKRVPLVWGHQHEDPSNVLGHAVLKSKDGGIYAYCTLNDTKNAELTKTLLKHGDVTSLSIWANELIPPRGKDVLHGSIKEVSVVLAGANPGATIEEVLTHRDMSDEDAIFFAEEEISLNHTGMTVEDDKDKKEDAPPPKDKTDDKETIEEVFNTLTEKQKNMVYSMVEEALESNTEGDEKDDDSNKEDKTMKHNVFERENNRDNNFLCHTDQEKIINLAKTSQVGSFQTALEIFADDNNLQHDALSSGFVQTGEGNVYSLFPEHKEVRPGAPELITNDQGWITTVMNKVHKSPISRIRTRQVDIRNIDALRARGYVKGKQKKQTGNFSLVRRMTDPHTVYVKNALHRDDITDITDFDYVRYLYNIDRMMLNEELAMAIMLGDGREEGDEDKIPETNIRPIWTDDELFTLHVDVDIASAKSELQGTNTGANFGMNYIYAEAIINTVLYARENYKGSGTPDFYCTPHLLNVMLLARDINGRRIYSSKAELASALNVGEIHTAEQFDGKTRKTEDNKTKKLLGIIANLADYSLGATKGGEVTHFTQFDIDFNQQKSLLETRCSGALTRVYSAIALEEDVSPKTEEDVAG